MDSDELERRARTFGLRVIHLADALPNTIAGRAIGNQLVRSGTSVGANYRAARRGRSRKEFAAKIGVVCEEADESEYWIGIIVDARLLPRQKLEPLRKEAEELVKIFAAMRRSLRLNHIATSPRRKITTFSNQ